MKRLTAAIPQTTTPLTKFIRTTEGWLIIAANAAILIATIFGSLPNTQALKWGAILNTATVISRSALKGVAMFAKDTGLTPIEPADVPTALGGLPTDDMTDTNTLSDKPQSGVVPDAGEPDPGITGTDAPSGGTGTGPAPGARIPGARRKG